MSSGWENKKGLAYPPNIQPGLEPWMERVRVTLEYLLDSSVKAARVVTVTLDVDDAGQVTAQMTPNENTKWIEYAWSTTAYPTIAEIQASGNEVRTWVGYYTEKGLGTTYSTPVLTTLTEGQTLYFGVIAYEYELDDQSAPSGTPSVPVYAEITFGPGGGGLVPTVQEQIDYYVSSGVSYGRLTLVISDPDSLVTAVEYKTKSGLDDWPVSWTSAPPGAPPQASYGPMDVVLTEKHNSHIAYKITYTGGVIEASITFDVDRIPEISEGFLTPDFKTWDVIYRYTGDDDTLSVRYAVSLDEDWATSALAKAAAEAGTYIDGRVGREQVYNALQEDHTLYMAVVAYDEPLGTGNVSSEVYRYELRRGTGGGVGSCPNLAPPDAVGPVGGTQAVTGTQTVHVWNVPIDDTGISRSGGDTVSACIDIRVGPAGTGEGDEITDDGKLMRTHRGLLYAPSMADANVLSQFTYGGYAASVYKNGRWVWEMDKNDPGVVRHVVNSAAYNSVGFSWYTLDEDGNIIPTVPVSSLAYEARYKLYLQANYQYEGTSSPLIGGSGINLDQSVIYRNWTTYPYEGSYYFMNCPVMGVVDDLDANDGYVYWHGTGTGLFSGTSAANIKTMTAGGLGASLAGGLFNGRPARFFIDTTPGETPRAIGWAFGYSPLVGGGDPLYTESVSGGPWYSMVGLENALRYGWSLNNNFMWPSVGRGWFWEVVVMEDQKVYFTGIPEGYYVQLRGDERYDIGDWCRAVEGADASGNCEVWLNWRKADKTRYGITPDSDWNGEFSAACPLDTVQIWDGPPWNGGSIVYEQTVQSGIYGGDVWNYDATGTQTPGETLTVGGKLRVECLASDGSTLEQYESSEAHSTLWTRVGASNCAVPNGTASFRLTLFKTGSAAGWAQGQFLQFNRGASCCDYSAPIGTTYRVDPVMNLVVGTGGGGTTLATEDVISDTASGTSELHVRQLWSQSDGQFVTAAELVDAVDEHRQGASNILQLGLAERETSGGSGSESGTAYPDIVLADHGIEPGQKISLRFQAKRET